MSDAEDIAALVLAAGSSRRFGSNKLLHPLTLKGVTSPLIAHSLRPWLEVFAQVTVVVKPDSQLFCSEVEAALGGDKSVGIRWLVCVDANVGMSASLGCGVRANQNAGGWLIGLADMPAVPQEMIVAVRDALVAGAAVAAPALSGRRGHPVGFSAAYATELLDLTGDVGARRILERDRSKIVELDSSDPGIFTDIDVPNDLDVTMQLMTPH